MVVAQIDKLAASPLKIVHWVDDLLAGRYDALCDEDPDLIEDTAVMRENAQALVDQFSSLQPTDYEHISQLAHDLRGHINGITGWAEIILQGLDGPITEAQESVYNSIMRHGAFTLSQIDKIVDFARLELGDIRMTRKVLPLMSILESQFQFYGNMAPFPITVDVNDDLPELHIDDIRLKQALYHLIENAFTHGDAETVTVRGTVNGENCLEIAVIDDGVGIADYHLPHLDEPFYQVDPAYPGLGLGLNVVSRYAEIMGGYLWIDSTPGQGTEAILTFPPA